MSDGIRTGSFSLSTGYLRANVNGRKMRVQQFSRNSFSILTGHFFKLQKLADVLSDKVEYEGEKYVLMCTESEQGSLMSIFRESDSSAIAVSNCNGTMESTLAQDPVLITIGILLLCVIRAEGSKFPEIPVHLEMLHNLMNERRQVFTVKLHGPLTAILLTSILLTQIHAVTSWTGSTIYSRAGRRFFMICYETSGKGLLANVLLQTAALIKLL